MENYVALRVDDLPAEVWVIICEHLEPQHLRQLAQASWLLRAHALVKVTHHSVTPLGLVNPPQRMVRALRRLSKQYGRLRSLDMTSWDNLMARVLCELPRSLLSLNLSGTTVTARGICVLSANIQQLDLNYANLSRQAIKNLAHLTSLRQLNLSHCKQVTASLLQYVPDTVEELDLSYCPSIEFEGRAKYPIYPSLMWQHSALAVKWPASLRALKLTGIKSATAALFSLPRSVRELDLSESEFTFARFDFRLYLPHLETLKAEDIPQFNCSSEKLWLLPDGLRSLSLRGSSADASNLKHLPTSITSLNLAHTMVTEYCSLYAQEKINYFFKDITRCLPNLRHIDLQCGYPYGTLKYGPWLKRHVADVVLDQPMSTPFGADVLKPASDDLVWRPREECEEWHKYAEQCAAERKCVRLQQIEDAGEQQSSDEDDEDDEEEVATERPSSHEVDKAKPARDSSGESSEDDELSNVALGCLLSV